MRNGLTVTTFVLADEGPGDGGFMCIPGSLKTNYALPDDVVSLDRDISVVNEVTAKAGSVIIFTEALSHGTLPWTGSHQRRAVLYKYRPGFAVLGRRTTCPRGWKRHWGSSRLSSGPG